MSAELFLFNQYTRANYTKLTGKKVPDFNPSLPPKYWEDPLASIDPMVYNIAVRDGNGFYSVQKLVLPVVQARMVNLPGAPSFPSWNPPVSGVTVNTGGSSLSGTLVDSELASIEDAKAMQAEFPGSSFQEIPLSPPPSVVNWGSTSRRCYLMTIPGVTKLTVPGWRAQFGSPLLVGFMQLAKNQLGIGHPGKWVNTAGVLAFVPDPDAATSNSLKPVDRPIRALGSNEELASGPFGVSVSVVTKALAGGGGSVDNTVVLNHILTIVQQIAAGMGITGQ